MRPVYLQSEILNLQADSTWLPDIGLQQGIPFLITVAGVVGLLVLDSAYRSGIIVSAIATIVALSVVVLTGLVGQISLATFALAGARAPEPGLFGIDIGISASGDAYPRVAFGVLVLAAMMVSTAIVVNLRQGATGRRWLAVRANERAAEAAGIPVAQVKLGATAVAAALAGLAGVLLAYKQQTVSAGSYGALQSLIAVAIAYLAGIAIPAAALLAGVLATGGLLTVVLDAVNEGSSQYQFAVNGLLLMVVAVRFPASLVGATAGARR